jgi:hypothetical protein
LRERRGGSESGDTSERSQRQTLPEHHHHDSPGLGAESETQAELAAPQGHVIRDDRV